MSEFQYYEFRAVDRPLTNAQMDELRALSSRARITSTSFVNTYNYGDFRGDPNKLMSRMFDAFVYVANWGTHELMFRLPKGVLDATVVAAFKTETGLRVRGKGEHVVLCLRAEELESDWEEGEDWMDSLLPVRADMIRGDLRALYLGWLRSVQSDEVEDEETEPPPPAGLSALPAHLESLVEFLDIDNDLLEAAAEASAELPHTAPSSEDLLRRIAALTEAEKNDLLVKVAGGEGLQVGEELLRRFRQSQEEPPSAAESAAQAARTAGELRLAAQRRAEERERREAKRARQEKERKARKRTEARGRGSRRRGSG